MAHPSRRRFLRTVGLGTGTVLLAPLASRRAAADDPRPGATGTLADVKHVVILMQENRSFDHYFGTLRGVRGFADTSTITLPELFSVFEQPNGDARQFPFPLRGVSGDDPARLAQCQGDVAHAWSDQHAAWSAGKLDAWMEAKQKIGTLGYLDRTDLGFYYGLADAYTICDAYHCSGITATGPNRTYLWSGTIDAARVYNGPAYDGGEEHGLTWKTYAETLEDAGISWRVYQNASDNFGDNGLAYFSAFTNAPQSSPLWQRGMASVPTGSGSTPADILAAIRSDVVAGTLPQVSWIVTDKDTSEHPSGPSAPVNGENFVAELLAALSERPEVLDSTVLLITYDENGGFFDHVPPPVPAEGTPDEFVGSLPIGLGFRVPMLIVSPWSRGGWVSSETFDHTSVIQFLERWSEAIGQPAPCTLISAWRRSVCGDLTSAFDFAAPVYGLPVLPQPGAPLATDVCAPLPNPEPSESKQPAQEPGARPARALPYQPNAWVTDLEIASEESIRLHIAMTNEGSVATKAAHFAVYANAHRGGGPFQYTVLDATPVIDFFNLGASFGEGKYDLSVVGPNRFLRRFTGDARGPGAGLEVVSSYVLDPSLGRLVLELALSNRASQPAIFSIRANAYRARDLVWTFALAPDEQAIETFDQLYYGDGWYDFSVTVDLDPSWSRRFVGHLESGEASVSADPASVGRSDPPPDEGDDGADGDPEQPIGGDGEEVEDEADGDGTEPGAVSSAAHGGGGCVVSSASPARTGLGPSFVLVLGLIARRARAWLRATP